MNKFFFIGFSMFFLARITYAQVVFIPTGLIGAVVTSETGFLPGKKFKTYKTINQYDFHELTLRVEIIDNRISLNLKKINCSDVPIENLTEFNEKRFIYEFGEYVDSIFKQANIKIDSMATNKVEISLEAIDSRLIGFGKIVAHGLCQLKIDYNGVSKIYCTDITDSNKNAPISSNSFVTRKTAIRLMGSASIRESLEQFLIDLKKVQ
jgi:hypothetical protein